MSVSELDKQTVELMPNLLTIPNKIEMPQYKIEEKHVRLEYINDSKESILNSYRIIGMF